MNGAYILGAIYCGFGILNGTMTYGMFTAVLQLVGQVQMPFANLSGLLPQYFAMVASGERLMEVEDYPEDPAAHNTDWTDNSFRRVGLEDVQFSYPSYDEGQEKTAVLEDFHLEIGRGEFVALTGPSGCGKSTVLKVLMALYPIEKGNRYVDFGNGKRELSGADRRLFSYVPQGNMLIQGSVRDIVSFGKPAEGNDDLRIWRALEAACAKEFVQELGDGLDTILGEQGSGLSEGQIQRLSIARALYADRKILLLDEATSALDSQTEKELLKNLKSDPDLTLIVVTHRPAALEIADRVIDFTQLHG